MIFVCMEASVQGRLALLNEVTLSDTQASIRMLSGTGSKVKRAKTLVMLVGVVWDVLPKYIPVVISEEEG